MASHRFKRRAKTLLEKVLRRVRLRESSEALSMIGTAIAIGVVVGLAAVGFDLMVHALGVTVHRLRVALGAVLGPLVVMLIPALGGLLITPIVLRFAPDVRGSGIPSVMLAVSNFGGRLPRRIAFWRPIASTLSIGTGASLGTEGPVVQLGASIASSLSDLLRLGDERRRSLVAVAAASGVAATFNAPIAGVLFALEVVLGQFGNRSFAAVVVGAVSASAVSRRFLGNSPAFAVPAAPSSGPPSELALYFLLGLGCAFVALAFIRLAVLSEDAFDRLRLSPWLRPAFGGLLVGALGLGLPALLGRGYDATAAILAGGEGMGLGLLALLMLGKMLATSLSLASWGAGGIFAPVLLVGAAFGAGFAKLFAFGALEPDPGAFALVGMAAVFAGTTRAPMSSIIMVFEISDGYGLILPLLLAAVVATVVAEVFHPQSFYQVVLSRRGLSLLHLRSGDLLQSVRVREVMDPSVPRLYADDTLGTFREALAESHHHGFVLAQRDDPEHLFGIVSLSDMERARQAGLPEHTPLREIGQRTVHCALPEEPLSDVLERMARFEIGRMPVVDERDRRKPIGFVRQSDLARAYYQALEGQRKLERQEKATRLRELTGQDILELRVRPESPLAGRALREAALPKESIVVAVRRRGRTIFPHGDTVLEPGDTVVANVAPGFGPAFRAHFEPRREPSAEPGER